MKKINKTFSCLSSSDAMVKELVRDLPDGNTLVAYASVEIVDSVGDVVAVDGIDWSERHNPDRGVYLPILGSHMVSTPDGTPPVVGRIERIVRTTADVDGKPTPAVAFSMTFATDGDGKVTDYAQRFKDLYEGGFLSGFSVGLLVDDAEPLKETGGWKYTKTRLYEVSATAVPCNSLATVLRAMDTFGKSFDVQRVLVEQLDALQKSVQKLADQVAEIGARNNPNHITEGLSTAVEAMGKSLAEKLDAQEARLDGIEASFVAASAKAVPPTSNRKTEHSLKEVEAMAQAIRQFAGR